MSPEQLLKHFDEISEAPDAVARLRRFILDLAVRGKLVEQDPDDEPASELLKRIEEEKARLVAAGEIKKEKRLAPVSDDGLNLTAPVGWVEARLGEIAACLDYRRVPVNNTERARRIQGKSPTELFPYYGATQQRGWIDDYLFDAELVLLGEDGVPFHEPLRAKAYVISGKSWVNNHAHVFRGILTSNRYLAHWLNVFDYSGRVAGATRSKLNQSKAISIPVPLPPLAEQHRIVAKVDELMALCDELEASQAKRETRRDRLVSATLYGLNNGDTGAEDRDGASFADSARFYFNHLPRLTVRPEHIHQLRQTILNLAVRGKLVAQDPNDEGVDCLLERIDEERVRVASEDRRADMGTQKLLARDCCWSIPTTWAWRGLADLALFIDYRGKTPTRAASGVPLVTAKNVRRGFINREPREFVTRATYDMWMTRGLPREGDVLFTTEAPMGNAAVVHVSEQFALAQRVIDLRPYGGLSSDFLVLQLLSESFRAILEDTATGLTAKGIKSAKLKRLPFAVPPLGEQRRIVAKVDELMALCDELEANLTTSATTRCQLLEATLHETLRARHESQKGEVA